MKRTILLLSAIFIFIKLSGQGIDCGSADIFCTGSTNTYPASVDVVSPDYGTYPNYGCLCTMPNPAWYYMKVGTPGNLVIHISTTPSEDIDFICWGPFTSLADACTNGLTGNCTDCFSGCPSNVDQPTFYPSGNITDCSYSIYSTEDCYINNAIAGQIYILLITNYSDRSCNIIFSQTNVGQAGAGSTNCYVYPKPVVNSGPFCVGDTLKLYADTISGATYNWVGPNSWTSSVQNPARLNATTAMSGNYICTIMSDTLLIAKDTTHVLINPNPIISVTSDTICFGDTATLVAFGATYYTWGNMMYGNPIKVSPPATTIYPVCGKDTNNCIGFANATVIVNPCAGIEENTLSNEITVYPNPAKDMLTIETNNSTTELRIEILNLLGQNVYTSNIINNKTTVNTSAFANGIYFLKLSTDKGTTVRKFVKE